MNKNKREEVMVVAIYGGIIMLIEPEGSIRYYRQKGIDKLDELTIQSLIMSGKLVPDWYAYPEIPDYYDLYYEDECICGKPSKYFRYGAFRQAKRLKTG